MNESVLGNKRPHAHPFARSFDPPQHLSFNEIGKVAFTPCRVEQISMKSANLLETLVLPSLRQEEMTRA